MEKPEKFADTSSESHSAGDSHSQTGEIVLAKFEALTSQNSTSSHGGGDNLDEQVLGYLEVQPSDLHVVQDNNTIYLQPQEIEIDGQHLILTQGDEAGEIIVVVSTDHENPSEQTVAELAQGAMVNAGVMTADSGEKTHTLVVSSTQSAPHIEVLDNIVGTSGASDDGTKKHAQIVIEETPFGQVSTSHAKANDKASEVFRTLEQKSCHVERTVKIVTSTGIHWSVPEEKSADRKEMKAEMLFIPASSTVSQSSGIPASILLSPSNEEGKDRRLMQLACIAQELQSKNHNEDNSSLRTKELDIEEPSTSQSITRQTDMVDSVTSAGNLEELDALPSLSSKNNEGVSSSSVVIESQESHIRNPTNSVNNLHLQTGSEVSSSNQLSESADFSSINSQTTHSTSASIILPQEVDSTISEKVLCIEENSIREASKKPDNTTTTKYISGELSEREVATDSRSLGLEEQNDTASSSSIYKECEIVSYNAQFCAKAESTPFLQTADTLRRNKSHTSQEDSGGISASVSSSSSQSPVKADLHIVTGSNDSTKKVTAKIDVEQFEGSSDADSVTVVTSFTTPFVEVDKRKHLSDQNSIAGHSSLNISSCLLSKSADFRDNSKQDFKISSNDNSSIDSNLKNSRCEILSPSFSSKSNKGGRTISDNSNELINESFMELSTLPAFRHLEVLSSEDLAYDNGGAIETDNTERKNSIYPDTLTDRDGKSTSLLGTKGNQKFQHNEKNNDNSKENINTSPVVNITQQNLSQDLNLHSQISNIALTPNNASTQPVQIDQIYCSSVPNRSEINDSWKEMQTTQNAQTSSMQFDLENKLKEFDTFVQDEFKQSNASVLCHETPINDSAKLQELPSLKEESIALFHNKISEESELDSSGENVKLSTDYILHETCRVGSEQATLSEENILTESSKNIEDLQVSSVVINSDVKTRKLDEISTSKSEESELYCLDAAFSKGIESQRENFETDNKKYSHLNLTSYSRMDTREIEKPVDELHTTPGTEKASSELGHMERYSSDDSDLPRNLHCKSVKDKNTLESDSIYSFNEVDSSTSEYEILKETECADISDPLESHEETMPVIQPIINEFPEDQNSELQHSSSAIVSYETKVHSLGNTSSSQKQDIKSSQPYLDKKQQLSSHIIPKSLKGGVKQIILNPVKSVSPLPSKLGTRTSSPTIIRITPECKKAESVQQIQEAVSENINASLLAEKQLMNAPECNIFISHKDDSLSTSTLIDEDIGPEIQKSFHLVHPTSDKLCEVFEEMEDRSSCQADENYYFEENENTTSRPSENETSAEQILNIKTLNKKYSRQRKASSTAKEITVQLETRSKRERMLQLNTSPLKRTDEKIGTMPVTMDLNNQVEEIPSSSREFDVAKKLPELSEMLRKRDNKRKMSNENVLPSERKKEKLDLSDNVSQKEMHVSHEGKPLGSPQEENINIDKDADTEKQTKKRCSDNLNIGDSDEKKLKTDILKYSSDEHNNTKDQSTIPEVDSLNLGLGGKGNAKDPITVGSMQTVTESVSPSKRKSRSNAITPTSKGGGRRHIHSSAAFDALRKQSKVLSTPPKFSRKYFELKHSRARSVPSVKKETTLVSMTVPQISPLKHCDIRIRCQTPSSPEKPSSTYQCVNCRFTTSRVENLIQHYKEKCLYDNSDIFEWGIEDMDRRQRIRGEEPKENGCALDFKQLTYQNSSSKVYSGVSGLIKSSECAEQSGGIDSDSDSDGLLASNCQTKNKFGFVEGDVVWVDWRRLHWPALVRRINHKEKRVSVMFIDTPTNKNGIKVGVKKIQSFNNAERNKKYLSEGRSTTFGESLVKAVQKAEDFLRKRCLGISVSAAQFFESFDDPDYLSDVGSSASSPSETGRAAQEQRLLEVSSDHGSPIVSPEESHVNEDIIPKDSAGDSNNSEVSVKRKQRRNQNAKLLQCIKDGKVETHLLGVYRNTITSDRHSKFNSSLASERNQLKHQLWFGPIDDEEQQEEIYEYCLHLFKSNFEYGESFDVVAYVFEVWVPEAIVKAISRLQRVTMSEAEELFARGVQWSKTDAEEPEREFTFAEEDQQEYRERMILRMRDAGVVEEINQTLAM